MSIIKTAYYFPPNRRFINSQLKLLWCGAEVSRRLIDSPQRWPINPSKLQSSFWQMPDISQSKTTVQVVPGHSISRWNASPLLLHMECIPVRVRIVSLNNKKMFPFFCDSAPGGRFNDITQPILTHPCPSLPLPHLCCAQQGAPVWHNRENWVNWAQRFSHIYFSV